MQAGQAAVEEPVLAQTILPTAEMLTESQPEVVLAPRTTSSASLVIASTPGPIHARVSCLAVCLRDVPASLCSALMSRSRAMQLAAFQPAGEMKLAVAGGCRSGAGDIAGAEQCLQEQWEADAGCDHDYHREAPHSTAGARSAITGQAGEHWCPHEALFW